MYVSDLECSRGERPLFSGLSFSLLEGELLWVKGPNGSGKTTLLRTLCGLLQPNQGDVTWQGQLTQQLGDDFQKDVLFIGHLNGIKHELTVLENIEHTLALSGQHCSSKRIIQAIDRFGLKTHTHKPCRQLSQGQKRKVSLTRLLLNDAPLWILDEPFVALDTHAVNDLTEILQEHLNHQGRIIFTTHQEIPFKHTTIKQVALH